MDIRFLKLIQARGWRIFKVGQRSCVAQCQAEGCGLKVSFTDADLVPQARGRGESLDKPIRDFETLRIVLRDRRQDLALTIKDVEHIAGLTVDHLAKFEKDNPSRNPTLGIIIPWAQSLGYELVLRPVEMPNISLREVADTRSSVKTRTKRIRMLNQRREKIRLRR